MKKNSLKLGIVHSKVLPRATSFSSLITLQQQLLFTLESKNQIL